MNGAELLMKTAAAAGLDLCFANFGTTEVNLVAALDQTPAIRAIQCLFEGVCTGAADGYARMSGKPGLTLLHLGLGLANGIANLHNAKKANSPLVNLVGEHATWHRQWNSHEVMDIQSLAGTVSGWVGTPKLADDMSKDMAEAVSAAAKGQVATLIIAQDCQWNDCADETVHKPVIGYERLDATEIDRIAELLKGAKKAALFLGSRGLSARSLQSAARVKAATGCDLISELLPARMERGLGLPLTQRLPYFPEQASQLLSAYDLILFAGAEEPVAFFAYKGGRSRVLAEHNQTPRLCRKDQDVQEALEALADALGAPRNPILGADPRRPQLPTGDLTGEKVCAVLAALQPEDAIIVDESVTSGGAYFQLAAGAPPHSLLTLTGGAIGQGPPCATGAALAAPDRPVINLQADGCAMYTLQALWTQARESLNVTTVICSNRSYDILRLELARAGHTDFGKNSLALTDLGNPAIDWARLGQGMGVPSRSVTTAEELAKELARSLAEPGPRLIEAVLEGATAGASLW
jgi:acetolactate synthase-1/2/3 large subunit